MFITALCLIFLMTGYSSQEEIREAKRGRRRAEKKWRKTKNAVDLTIFKVKRNALVSLMNKARKDFYTNFI